jgi:mRNA interferase MazF
VSRVRPWEVWLADFGLPIGGEPGGVRPAVVVASELHCRFPIDMTVVVPLTTRDRGFLHHVSISSPDSGLDRQSWARTEDITAISTRRLSGQRPIGRLSDVEATQVSYWLKRMIAGMAVPGGE